MTTIATIDKGSIISIPQMKVVWELGIIIDKHGLFNSLFISDVDLADGKGRLTVICREQFIFVSHQG